MVRLRRWLPCKCLGTAIQQGGGCLSVCLFLSCPKLCLVLGGTAGASMDSSPALFPRGRASPLPISLPTGSQRGAAEQRVQPPPFPLAAPCLLLLCPY